MSSSRIEYGWNLWPLLGTRLIMLESLEITRIQSESNLIITVRHILVISTGILIFVTSVLISRRSICPVIGYLTVVSGAPFLFFESSRTKAITAHGPCDAIQESQNGPLEPGVRILSHIIAILASQAAVRESQDEIQDRLHEIRECLYEIQERL